MRISRPGCVVGPQQQYMYLKQLEWCKWSAYDEVKRIRNMSAAASTAVVAPATPPAEEDERMDISDGPCAASTTAVPVPPVTPSKHVARAQAQAREIAPPAQPRKTPITKRVATDSDAEEEEDVLPALGVAPAPVRRKSKPQSARPAGVRGTVSEQRPTRVTRSAAGAAAARRTAATASTALTTAKGVKANGQAPNKIPRLANGTSVRGTKEGGAVKEVSAAMGTTRKLRNVPSPIPSRLPTLVAKRAHHGATASVTQIPAAALAAAKSAGAWVTTNAAAVVSREGRPNLRPIRRRRSSFSSADVVA